MKHPLIPLCYYLSHQLYLYMNQCFYNCLSLILQLKTRRNNPGDIFFLKPMNNVPFDIPTPLLSHSRWFNLKIIPINLFYLTQNETQQTLPIPIDICKELLGGSTKYTLDAKDVANYQQPSSLSDPSGSSCVIYSEHWATFYLWWSVNCMMTSA